MNQALAINTQTVAAHVVAPLIYVPYGAPRPRTLNPPKGAAIRQGEYRPYDVTIADARALGANIDREGFELRASPTAVTDFLDDDQIANLYYPEINQLIIEATGASRVEIFDSTRRFERKDASDGPRAPVHAAHNDYTEKSAPQRVRDLLGDMAERLLGRRYAFINVWRPLKGPVLSSPLAVADARTVAPGDLVATDLVYSDRVGEIYHLHPNPEHRWFYYPEMTTDEALLLKCFDSATDGTARFAPHTAFADPNTRTSAPGRESIEIRTIAFFDP
jgi:hypothetical protein